MCDVDACLLESKQMWKEFDNIFLSRATGAEAALSPVCSGCMQAGCLESEDASGDDSVTD